jgi:hypothetical protein
MLRMLRLLSNQSAFFSSAPETVICAHQLTRFTREQQRDSSWRLRGRSHGRLGEHVAGAVRSPERALGHQVRSRPQDGGHSLGRSHGYVYISAAFSTTDTAFNRPSVCHHRSPKCMLERRFSIAISRSGEKGLKQGSKFVFRPTYC